MPGRGGRRPTVGQEENHIGVGLVPLLNKLLHRLGAGAAAAFEGATAENGFIAFGIKGNQSHTGSGEPLPGESYGDGDKTGRHAARGVDCKKDVPP